MGSPTHPDFFSECGFSVLEGKKPFHLRGGGSVNTTVERGYQSGSEVISESARVPKPLNPKTLNAKTLNRRAFLAAGARRDRGLGRRRREPGRCRHRRAHRLSADC